ncbi:hypothetical protein PV726_44845, partial [Streptomyces europaeiscabiei]|nr:hypothetical protein [Streptomyces europaeiscabiei]
MNTLATVLLSALPLAAGWAAHVWWLRGCLNTARRDPLTGLRTRDGFTHRATALLRDPRAVVVLADVDKFSRTTASGGTQRVRVPADVRLRRDGSREKPFLV